jgi:glycine oxidase
MDVLVVGGGVIGLSCACTLAADGHNVELVERERTGTRASWVAAGLLTPSSPWKYPPGLIELATASEAMYPDYVADLVDHTGLDPQFEDAGILYPEGVGTHAADLAAQTAQRIALGFDVQHLDREALDALQPGLGPTVTGAAFQSHCTRLRPPRLLAALRKRALRLDVTLIEECDVVALNGGPSGVTGITTHTGQRLGAEAVVLAAGAWSGELAASLGLELDVRPVRGQILLLRGEPGVLIPTLNDGDEYLLPRRDGRILVGSTMEDVGFEAVNTSSALEQLRRQARVLLPATEHMEEETYWAGLRPATPDRLPYLGPVPEIPGLVLATGHYRNGILLAPVTARCVADVLAGRTPPVDLSPFAPRPVDPEAVLVVS